MRFSFIFILFVSWFPIILFGQDKALLAGVVKNSHNKPIPQALVAINQTTTGVYTDDNGFYTLEIVLGKHTITVSALGYKTNRTDIDISRNLHQDFTLEYASIHLSTVEVHGKTKSQHLREGSFTVNSLDVKPLANSLNNLNNLIGRSSGIKIREEGGVGADFDLSINGLSGNSVRYFMDGVPLHSIGNGVSLANLPINIVDRIEIYKGVVPANLGTDALGGAINIITHKGGKKYIDFSYGLGSFDTHKADLNAQFIDKKTGIFINPIIGVNYSKNNYMMKGVEMWNSSTSEFEKINVKRFHDDYFSFFSQLGIGVKGKRWADQFIVSTSYSYVDNDLQTGAVQSIVYGMAKRENKSYNISAQYSKQNFLMDKLSANLFTSYTWDNSTVVDTVYRKYRWDGSYSESSRNEITGRGKSIRNIERPLIIGRANFNYELDKHNSINLNYVFDRVLNKRSDDVDLDFEPTEDSYSKHIVGLSYVQSFWNDKLTNNFFVKDYISNLNIEQQDLYWITGSNKVDKNMTSNNWGYGLSSRLRIIDQLSIKGSYEHAIRLPIARESLGNGTTVYPNFTLKPESGDNVNLGLFGFAKLAPKHTIYYETNLFYRKVKNYIRLVISEAEGMSQYANVNNVTVRGIEGEVRYSFNNIFQAIANVSYLDEKNKTKYQSDGKPEITYNNRMPNRPWFYGNVELNLTQRNLLGVKNNQLRLAYYFQYVHWFYLTWEGYGILSSKSRIPTQYLSNAEVTYSLQNQKYNISLDCNNIFDRTVYDNYMMQKPGRAFFCKFRVFFN